MNTKPLFVMVFAGDCGACINFKSKELESVRNAFRQYKDVDVVEVHLKSMQEKVPTNVNGRTIPDINPFIYGYPTFIFLSKQDIESGKLNPAIYGVMLSDGEPTRVPTAAPNKDTLLDWVKENNKLKQNTNPGPKKDNTREIKILTEASYYKLIEKQ